MADIKDLETELQLKAALAERLALEKELKTLKEQLVEIQQGSIEDARIAFELSQKEQELRLANLEIQKQQLEAAGALSDEQQNSLQQINKQIEDERKAAKDSAKAGKEKLKLLEKDEEHNKHIKKLVFGIGETEEKRRIKLKEVLNISKEITKEQAVMALKQKLSELSWASLAAVEKGAMTFNQISTSVNAATNTAGFYNDTIRNVSMSHSRMGITGEDAQRAIIALREDFSAMSNMSKEAQDGLVDFSAQMEKAGISSQTTAKFLNTATRSMGMGVEQVKKYETELFAFSRANGISMKVINDGLGNIMPRLAAFGKDAPKIFKDLAFQAKQMGVEMGKILDVTEKFTTFEGAAEAVGELNSVLGGNYLDSLEMLRAASDDPVKAQEMLRDALQKTGKSFDQLSGQQRRMFASMLGTDMDTAAGFFKQTSAQAKQAALTQEQFNDAVAAFTTIGDKLKTIFGKLAPAFQLFATITGKIVDLFTQLLDIPGVAWFIAITGGVLAAGAALFGLLGTFIIFIGQTIIAGKGIAGIIAELFGLGSASTAAGAAMAAGGAEAAAGGAGFTAAGGEVAAGSTAAAGGIASFVTIVTPFLPFLGSIALVILSIGAAFLMMGLSIALILAGVIGVVVAIGYLFKILIDGGTASLTAAISFGILSISLYALAAALAALGTIGSIGIGVLIVLTALILSMGLSFAMIGEGISKAETGISSLMSFDLTKLDTMKDKLTIIAEVVERMSAAATIFSAAMSNPIMMPVMAAAVAAAPALQNSAIAASGKSSAISGAENSQINVTIKIDSPIMLDKRELGRFVTEKIAQLSQSDGNTLASPVVDTGRVTV